MKVAFCVPSMGFWQTDMAVSAVDMARTTGHELFLMSLCGSQPSYQRNQLVESALELGVDALFWVDSDIRFPPTALNELVDHDKDIVGAVYVAKVSPHPLVGTLYEGTGRLREAAGMPGGMMLVRASVYKRIGWPYYFEKVNHERKTVRSEDISFCFKAREKGFKIWCDIDLSQRIAHIGNHAFIAKFPEGF